MEFTLEQVKSAGRKPEFDNFLKVLSCKKPNRYTLGEIFINEKLLSLAAGADDFPQALYEGYKIRISAFANLGYDYFSGPGSWFCFKKGDKHHGDSISQNEGALIFDRDSFAAYEWNNPDDFDYSALEKVSADLPSGMKGMIYGPSGVLENVIDLCGYDNLCYMLADDEELVAEMFDHVGSRLLRYYEICASYDSVGVLVVNDDWGFNTQTMLSTEDMRRFVIPWHKRIAQAIHSKGKPTLMHSCGNLEKVYDDIIDEIEHDGKHSFEDKIEPIEKAYDRLAGRIALVGGIDVDYLARRTPQEIYERSLNILRKTQCKGYALGAGNSIPKYIPYENYFAMLCAALLGD